MTKVTINGTFYAKVTNEANGEERVATMSITNIDSNKPVIEKLETSEKDESGVTASIKVTVTAKDNETGIPSTGAYKWYLDDDPTPKATTDVNYYTFTNLTRGQRMTHTFKVEVTDNVGNTQVQSTEAIPFPAKPNEIIKPENYGDKIEYSANDISDWKIFYADENYVYITTSYFLPTSNLPSGSKVKPFSGSGKNEYNVTYTDTSAPYLDYAQIDQGWDQWFTTKPSQRGSNKILSLLADLIDTSSDKWGVFKNEYADSSIGAIPTELFIKSFNGKYGSDKITLKNNRYYCYYKL